MRQDAAAERVTKVAIVQPVQSPYWTERLKVLARSEDLDLTLLLERGSFAHRPGWQPLAIDGVRLEVLQSMAIGAMRAGDDLGYRVQGVRSIPWRLVPALRRLHPDVVVVCNATEILLALPLRSLLRFRLALIVEDTPHASRNLGALARWIKEWAYRRADRWFAFSEDARTYLNQIGIAQGVALSSWSLDMGEFQPSSSAESPTRQSGATEDRAMVLFVGQIIPRKGVTQLLEAWKQLSASLRGKSRLVLVGDGPLLDDLRLFVREHGLSEVEIRGQQDYGTVRQLMQQAALFVLPTMEDLFSLTVVEAMACGCPVITTPFNGARELVEEGVNGWIADPSRPGALTASLARALSPDVDLRKMGAAARLRVEGMDNVPVMARFAEGLRALARGRSAE